MERNAINGAHIFATGEWNGKTFTEADLDGIVASFDALALSGKVPLKFGHNGEQPVTDGKPALGWVKRIWREGADLLADFTDMPTMVYDAIKKGLYKFVSIELLREVKADTRRIPWVLDAVALLGADQPAVGTLRDLQALTMSRGTALQWRERVAFRRDFSNSGVNNMTDEVKELREAMVSVQGQLATFAKANESLAKANDDLKADLAKRTVDAHRASILAVFERAIHAQEILPAAREGFSKVYKVDDDKSVMGVTAADATAWIENHPSPDKGKRKMESKASGGKDDKMDFTKMTPDEEVTTRATLRLRSEGKDPADHVLFTRAVQQILTEDSTLGERYKFMPDDNAGKQRGN